MYDHSAKGFLSFLHRRSAKKDDSHLEEKEEERSAQGNPLMEAGLGRRYTRANIKSFLGRVQHTLQKSLGVERVLQPSTGIEKTEDSRDRAQERVQAASEVLRVNDIPGFKHYVEMMRKIEGDAYFNLRTPAQLKKDNLSLDYTVGFYAGALSVIDDFFYVQQHAEKVIAKENARIKKEVNEKR